MQIKQALRQAETTLTDSPSAQLDAQILLARVLDKGREFLLSWPEKELSQEQQEHFLQLLAERQRGIPIAYLTGRRAFWDFDLEVNTDVLIPRPETELLVELALQNLKQENQLIADLGTGSGAIALALARERPQWKVIASDTSAGALNVARRNAETLALDNLDFRPGSWCEVIATDEKLDALLANPPYIDPEDHHLQQGDLRFEPKNALVAGAGGMADLQTIVQQAREKLLPRGLLLLEHGYQQAAGLQKLLQESGYNDIETHQDLAGLDRVTLARR
ncbi:MAG: protein-(glutamine-N5) methyltransferase, release factor-specific [Gammaproteobacteria bacterium]|nr:protein-(glutamine-N5) methyltransferase, release factor-specific [Gammaproteobacteria bacterium]|tara:strand:- start:262 stop:1092 length:831 start_codon:yes stop_codon:yes gene_type:complete